MKKITKIVLLLFLLGILPDVLPGQSYVITGIVKDYQGEIILDPSISLVGTTIRASMSFGGVFRLRVPTGHTDATLEISYSGLLSQKIPINKGDELEIVLLEDRCLDYGLELAIVRINPYNAFLTREKEPYTYGLIVDQNLYYKEANSNQEIDLLTGLNESPGLSISTKGLNTSSVNIRGIPTQKIKIDQIPLYTGGTNSLLEDLEAPMFEVAHLEKGANFESGMQQGGQINITSEYDRPFLSSMTGIGGHGYFKTSNSLKLVQEYDECFSRHFSINHSLTQSDGYRENSSYRKHSFTVNAIPKGPDEDKPYKLFLHYATVKKGLAGPLDLDAFEKNPQMANPAWAAVGAFDNHQTGMAGFSKKFILWEKGYDNYLHNTNSLFGIWNNGKELNPSFLINNNMFVWGGKTNFEYRKSPKTNRMHALFGGFEYYDEWLAWETFETEDLVETAMLNKNQERRTYFDFSLGAKQYFEDRFYLLTGLNINKSVIKTKDQFDSDTINYNRSRSFRPVFSPQIEGGYNNRYSGKLINTVVGKISHGLARTPTGSISTPENPLRYFYRPERSWNYEVNIGGTKYSMFGIDDFKLEFLASLYFIRRNNMLRSDSLALGRSYQNDGEAEHGGFELFLKRVGRYMECYTSYNYALSRFKDFNENGQSYKDLVVPGISPHTVNVGLLLKSLNEKNDYRWFYARFNYEYRSAMPITNDNQIYSESYHLLQAKIGFCFTIDPFAYYSYDVGMFKVSRRFKDRFDGLKFDFYAGVNNLLNQQYASSFVVPDNLQHVEGAYYYPGIPRYIYVGVKMGLIRNSIF